MASQRVFIITIGGVLADCVWKDICRWSDARITNSVNEWSSDDWPSEIRQEADAFVAKLEAQGYLPPILYRSEHVDSWSMGDVFTTALEKAHPDGCRRVLTATREIIATRLRFTARIRPARKAHSETKWLYARINEAIAASGEFAEYRLVILVRTVIGGLWLDNEVEQALATLPEWWDEIERKDD